MDLLRRLCPALVVAVATLSALAGPAAAQEAAAAPVQLADRARQDVSGHFTVYRNEGSPLSLREARQRAAQGKFNPIQGTNFGLTQDEIWLRLAFTTPARVPERLFLQVAAPTLDRVDAYIAPQGGTFTTQRAGVQRSFGARPLPHRTPVFDVPVEPNTAYIVYLRVASTSLITVPATLWQPDAFQQASQRGYTILSLYFGAILALLGYNLFLYISLRDPLYLLYIGFIAFLGLSLANVVGLAKQFLWPDTIWLAERAGVAAGALSGAFAVLFVQRFLAPMPQRLRLGWLMPGFAGLFLLIFVAALTSALPLATQAVNLASVASTVAALGLGLASLYYRHPGAGFFVLPWTALLVGIGVFALTNLGILPANALTANSIMIGSGLEMMLLALALAHRINILQEARDRAQQHALDTEQARVTALQELAYRDSLTGLPSRNAFIERLDSALTEGAANALCTGVVAVGLDGFRTISGSAGHEAADTMLQTVAERLQDAVPRDASVGRLGGDVFGVLIPGCRPGEVPSLETLAWELIDSVDQPVSVKQRQLRCGGSVGIAVAPRHGEDAAELAKNAELALYRAKQGGGNSFAWFDPQLVARAQWLQERAHGLRRALDRGELLLVYQPQLDRQERLAGVEALMRWEAPGEGRVSPGDFIPVAEETGLIAPMGDWALEEACAQAAAWRATPAGPRPTIAVNLAGPHLLDPDLPQRLQELLAEYSVPASALELEVTESAVMADMAKAVRVLERLGELGCTIAVDDFGTGHSSLAYLKRLPVHRLKIDRAFVMNLPDDAQDVALCSAILELGRSLDLAVVAEGVETRAQLDWLRARGCDIFQGFYFAKPMAAEDVAAWQAASA